MNYKGIVAISLFNPTFSLCDFRISINLLRMKQPLYKTLRWLPALAIMVIIFTFSSMQDKGIKMPSAFKTKPIDIVVSKSAHVFLFGSLAVALEFGFGKVDKNTKLLIVILVMLYGISDEIHQWFVPNREPRIIDVAIDTFAGWMVAYRKPITSEISRILAR
jgi:VanZ family protein